MAFNVQNMNALIVDLKAKGVTITQEPDAQPWGVHAMIRDQTQAYDVYVNKLGFEVHTDMTMENGFHWLTVTPPGQPEVEIVLSEPVELMFSPDLIPHVRALLDRDVMSGGVWEADDCQMTYEELKTRGHRIPQTTYKRVLRDRSLVQRWLRKLVFADRTPKGIELKKLLFEREAFFMGTIHRLEHQGKVPFYA